MSTLEVELSELYNDVDTVDGRARILLLQELIRSTRFADTNVQSAVYRHVQENMRIERRNLSIDVPELSLDLTGVTSEELTVDVDISGVEALMAEDEFEAASILLDVCRFDNSDCGALWLQNHTAWASKSLQEEVTRFQLIQQMPEGQDRREALEESLTHARTLAEQFSDTEQFLLIDNHIANIEALLKVKP